MAFIVTPRIRRLALIAFCAAVLFAVTMALLPKPPKLPGDELGDKFHHVLAFAVMTGLGLVAFRWDNRWRLAERLSFLGAMIEVAQAIPALHRDCDIRDWVADTLAVLVVTGIAVGLNRPRRHTGAPKADARIEIELPADQ
ncbi:MAG: hypothetical protein ABIW31_08075 [Novosphingobium sp.]